MDLLPVPANVHAFGNQQLTGQQSVLKQINMLVHCCSRFDATACVGEVMQDTAAVALLLLLLLLCCYVAMTSFVLLP